MSEAQQKKETSREGIFILFLLLRRPRNPFFPSLVLYYYLIFFTPYPFTSHE